MNEAKLNEMSIKELRESLEEQMNYSYELRLKTDKLQNNWNELKEKIEAYINENRNEMINTNSSIKSSLISAENDGFRKVLNKMQEIESRK